MKAQRNWKKIGMMALAVCAVLASAGLLYASGGGEAAHGAAEAVHGAAEAASHGGEHGGSLSHEKLMDLLWRTLNFIGLVIILVKFTSKPIANALRSRREGIRAQFEELDAAKAEAEQMYKEYEGKLASLDAEVQSIIDAAVAQAESEKEKILADAERAAADIKRQAENAVQFELTSAQKRLREEVAEKAAIMAEELIRKNLQPTDQEQLVSAYLDKVGGVQ